MDLEQKKECVNEASLFENNKNTNRKTLEDVFELFYEDKENQGLKATTLYTIKGSFNRIIKNFKFSKTSIALIQPEHINEFIRSEYFSRLAPQTKVLLLSFFKSIFTFAVKKNIIKNNIFLQTSSIKNTFRIRKIWNETELRNYMPILKKFKYFDIVLLALETGMRKGEILGLTWDCINFEKRILFVEKNLVTLRKEFYIHKPKTRAGIREIILFKDSLKMLEKRYEERTSDFVFHEKNKPICPVKLSSYFNNFLKSNNLKLIHFHDLRHIHATFLLNNKIDYKILSKRLGHTNIAFTLQTYTHVLSENEKSVLMSLPKIYI